MTTIKFVRVHVEAKLPTLQTPGSSGMDVTSVDHILVPPFEHRLIKTGWKVEIPLGFEIQVRSRSGLALKNGISVLNSPGTVDSDYRGEIGVILNNNTHNSFQVCVGDRIAQLVVCPIALEVVVEEASELSDTIRGEGGFGHSGIK